VSLNFVKIAKEKIKNNQGYARTGCTLLDLVVGGGSGLGFRFGKVINIIGDKSSGKTILATEIIAKNYYDYKKKLFYNYDDCEDGYTFDTKHIYGFDLMENSQGYVSDKIEDLDGHYEYFLKKVKSGNRGIYVVDSLDGLSNNELEDRSKKRSKAVMEGKDYYEGSYNMGTASFLSKEFFRTKTGQTADKNILFIIISQVRDRINATMFQKKHIRSGGKALDFYAHTCLWLANLKKITKKVGGVEEVVGIIIKAKAEKSKTARPFRSCVFSLYFDYGIDNIGSNLDYLFDLRGDSGMLLAKANKIFWKGKEANLENLKTFLIDNQWDEQIRTEKKEETGKKNLSVDYIIEWLERDEKRKGKMSEYFGESASRDELIVLIDNDKKMEEELEIRVIAKWEEMEEQLKTNRKRKY
jgi:RecA/RadA recombinase